MTGTKPKIEKLIFALGITGEDALLQLGMTDIPFVLSLWIRIWRNIQPGSGV